MKNNQIYFDNVKEVLERPVKAIGTSGRVNVPKKYIGQTVKVVIFEDTTNEQPTNQKQ